MALIAAPPGCVLWVGVVPRAEEQAATARGSQGADWQKHGAPIVAGDARAHDCPQNETISERLEGVQAEDVLPYAVEAHIVLVIDGCVGYGVPIEKYGVERKADLLGAAVGLSAVGVLVAVHAAP